MEEEAVSNEGGQRTMDAWFNALPHNIEENYEKLLSHISKFESFQLIANVTHYNHIHDSKKYTDYRGDRMFIIPEIVAILCINKGYVKTCTVPPENFMETIKDLQETAGRYFAMSSALESHTENKEETTLEQVTRKMKKDEILVRNPGLPDHHLILSEALFKPLESELETHFGFTVADSISIRKKIFSLFSDRFFKGVDRAKAMGKALKDEVVRFRNTKVIDDRSELTRDQFIQLQNEPSKKLIMMLSGHYLNELYINLGSVYAFTDLELAKHCGLSLSTAQNFLKNFSIDFDKVDQNENAISPNSILKSKPIIHRNGSYILPSFSLLTWCVEPSFETFLKSSQKLANKYKDIKHDFLLDKGMELLSAILSNATPYPKNLYYEINGKSCETDGLIGYDTKLFIIEAKGQRITAKAKDGNFQRTESHLKELIRDSSAQARRTRDYIKSNEKPTFYTKNKREVFEIDPAKYDEFILISLVLEPIGNLTPLIKVESDLNYFSADTFPWIISLYDLMVVADHIDLPIMLLHYLKRRKRFLEFHNMSVYEEIDLLAYFLNHGLYIENTIKEAKDKNITWLSYDNNTDEINDYYYYKFGHKTIVTPKVKSYLTDDFISLLQGIENSNMEHRTKIMLEILEASSDSIKKLLDYVKQVRKQYLLDGEIHDCSIGMGNLIGGVGITYMVGRDQAELDFKLYNFCLYKMDKLRAVSWVGIGDLAPTGDNFNIKCSFIAKTQI